MNSVSKIIGRFEPAMLAKLIKAVKSARRWDTALNKASLNQFQDALILMEEIYVILGLVPGDKKAPCQFNIFTGYLMARLHAYQKAILILSETKVQIADDEHFTESDKNYLTYYANLTICWSALQAGDIETIEKCKTVRAFDISDLQKVKSHLRIKFPITATNSSIIPSG